MFRSACPILSAFVVCVAVMSAASELNAQGGRVTLADGRVSFAPPQGFSPMSEAEIRQFLPHLDTGTSAIGDKTRGATLTYRFVPIKLTRPQLDQFRRYLTQTFEQASADLRWIANQLDAVGGQEGIRMEFRDAKQIHHITLVGYVDDDHVVMMSYNIPATELARFEPAVRASIASVRIGK